TAFGCSGENCSRRNRGGGLPHNWVNLGVVGAWGNAGEMPGETPEAQCCGAFREIWQNRPGLCTGTSVQGRPVGMTGGTHHATHRKVSMSALSVIRDRYAIGKTGDSPPPPFNLLRWFSLVSLVVIASVAIGLGIISTRF